MRKNDIENENEWQELFHIKDWSWKDSVLKILQGFTEKTEGSYITIKEAILSWYYKDCDIYFGHVQANEINTHLQNIYENCKIDIVNGKGYVEIKPKNVNKGYFISHIIKQEFIDKADPDFILSVGDDISDEEMFKYLNSVHNQLTFFKDNIKVFSCTICRKPSSAKYYLNEIYEVYEYLESLNQTHHLLRKESKKKSMAKLSKSKHSLNLMDLPSMNNFNI
jgi:trehalose 6-phosphate synthase/phosphatase